MADPWVTIPKNKEEDWVTAPRGNVPKIPVEKPGYWQETLSNVPESGLGYGEAITAPIHSPLQTAKGIGQLAGEANIPLHVLQSVLRGEELFPGARAIAENFAQRYGGWEKFKETFKKDPVGVLGDFSAALTGAGGVIPKIGRVGQALEPLNLARRVTSWPLRLTPESVPQWLYKSAAKFSTKLTPGERTAITETALVNEIGLSIGGVNKLQDLISDLRTTIGNKVDEISRGGRRGMYRFDPKDFFKDYQKLYDEGLLSGRPMENIKTLDRIKKNITDAFAKAKPQGLAPDELQRMKVNIYNDLGDYFSQVTESPISKKAQATVARAAKEELESLIPEIKGLNAKEGALLDLQDALEKAANRITNRDFIGIGMPIKGATGGIVGGTAGAAVGVALGILDLPLVKSKIAIVLDRLRQKGITVKPTPTAIRLGLFETSKTQEEVSK